MAMDDISSALDHGAMPDEVDSPVKFRFPLLLRRAWYGLNQAFRRRIVHLGITPDQYTVLRNLCEKHTDGLTQKDLTQRMSSDPNTVASLLERMESAGLLTRKIDDQDRRARRIMLSAVGKKRFYQAQAIAQELQGEVLGALNGDDCPRFMHELGILADACREAADRSLKGTKPS